MENRIKIGSIVEPKNYLGQMIVDHLDEMLTEILGENHWFCISEEYDTHFDTYSESELKIIKP